jgi:hypothetical protein
MAGSGSDPDSPSHCGVGVALGRAGGFTCGPATLTPLSPIPSACKDLDLVPTHPRPPLLSWDQCPVCSWLMSTEGEGAVSVMGLFHSLKTILPPPEPVLEIWMG